MSIQITHRFFLPLLFLAIPLSHAAAQNQQDHAILLNEFRPIGGGGNNLANPAFNAVPGSPELAIAPLNFGSNNRLAPAPNPRVISTVIAGGTGANGQNAETEDTVATAWLYVFGQFLDHDIDLEETPPTSEAIDITISANDPVFPPGTTIPMTRDTRSPVTNTIINTVAGYLDLSQLYGSTQAIADSLTNPDGTLTTSSNGQQLPIINDTFVTGDPRVMENPELTAITTLFLREHNSWVARLQSRHSDWSGQQLYNMARSITTAEYQNIVFNEYLPVLIGPVLPDYKGYDPTVNAQATQEFSTAAFRVGHSQISDTQTGLDNNGNIVFTQPLAEAFFNTPEIDIANGTDPLIRSFGVDSSQATDVYTVSALCNLLFAGLVGGEIDVIDLIAIDIRRESDVGLGTLNQTRKALGLTPYASFTDLTPDPVLQANLATVYQNIDSVDLFIGGLAENHASGAVVGPTFQTIITDQFQSLRAGDRFFWLNQGFNPALANIISHTTLADIVRRNTDTTMPLQSNLFLQQQPGSHHNPHADPPSQIDTHGRRPGFHN
jgi:peroxidase